MHSSSRGFGRDSLQAAGSRLPSARRRSCRTAAISQFSAWTIATAGSPSAAIWPSAS